MGVPPSLGDRSIPESTSFRCTGVPHGLKCILSPLMPEDPQLVHLLSAPDCGLRCLAVSLKPSACCSSGPRHAKAEAARSESLSEHCPRHGQPAGPSCPSRHQVLFCALEKGLPPPLHFHPHSRNTVCFRSRDEGSAVDLSLRPKTLVLHS